jgi:hypothetical protein
MQGDIPLTARWRQPTCRCWYGSLSKRSYRQHASQVHTSADDTAEEIRQLGLQILCRASRGDCTRADDALPQLHVAVT